MAMQKKLAVLAAAAEAARRYAKKNPDAASKYVDQAAGFVDKQTKGKYHGHINGAAQKAKSAAGIDPTGPVLLRVRPRPAPLPPDPTAAAAGRARMRVGPCAAAPTGRCARR